MASEIANKSPLDAISVNGYNYVVYFSKENKLTFKYGPDAETGYGTKHVLVDDGEINADVEKTSITATAVEDVKGTSDGIRVYYTVTDANEHILIRELIGSISPSDKSQVAWTVGGLTKKQYRTSAGTELGSSSSKGGVLRVFFVSFNAPEFITEAHFDGSDWKEVVLKG